MISVSIELIGQPGAPALTLTNYEPTATGGGVLVSVDVPLVVNYTP
jgi:hypothetical protein